MIMKHRHLFTAAIVTMLLLSTASCRPDNYVPPVPQQTETESKGITETESIGDTSTGTENETEPESDTETVGETMGETVGETTHETETDTEPETATETETEEPAYIGPISNLPSPMWEQGFVPQETYRAPITHASGSAVIQNPDGFSAGIDYDSTFFGTESAVDRDTFHWGDIMSFHRNYADRVNVPFVMGDLDGDRKAEMIYVDGTTLMAVSIPRHQETSSSVRVFSQNLRAALVTVGTGRFNGDDWTDILLYHPESGALWLGYGHGDGFVWHSIGRLPDTSRLSQKDALFAGDFDGDGRTDLVLVNDLTVKTYRWNGENLTLHATSQLLFADEGQFNLYTVADLNSDGCADVVCAMSEVQGDTTTHYLRTYFSRRDGHFGSYAHEGNNKNANPTCTSDVRPLFMTGGDSDGDGVDNLFMLAEQTIGRIVRVFMFEGVYPSVAPAYDYSSHIIRLDDGTYILYSGGTYCDYNTDRYPQTDADHLLAYTSPDGLHWFPVLDGACFLLGGELGMGGSSAGDKDPETGLGIPGTGDSFSDKWWIGNTMEPEVIRDPKTGIFYMYWQVENYCYNEDGTLMGADRIGVATSTDGIHFERKTDRPVIVTDDIFSCFTHQEVIYVPDDPDGKCWWMYVRYVHKNNKGDLEGSFENHVRIRSADPTCFDMTEGYEIVRGLQQIGNQIGYISNFDGQGHRLFLRITFAPHDEGTGLHGVPTLQFSFDGLTWKGSTIRLAGADLTDPWEADRPNIYFLGMSTCNGTGELYRDENGTFRLLYIGCTSSSPTAPNIFYSSEGVGEMTFTLKLVY